MNQFGVAGGCDVALTLVHEDLSNRVGEYRADAYALKVWQDNCTMSAPSIL